MPYTNNYKLANGATIQVGATTFEDAISIEVPSNMVGLVDITTLGSTRKEYAVSDMPDSDEVRFQAAYSGSTMPTLATASSSVVSVTITLPKVSKTLTFNAHVTKVGVVGVEMDGKLSIEVTLKPVTVPTY